MVEVNPHVLKVKDGNGNWISIPVLKETHTYSFEENGDVTIDGSTVAGAERVDQLKNDLTPKTFSINTTYGTLYCTKCGYNVTFKGSLSGLSSSAFIVDIVTDARLAPYDERIMQSAFGFTSKNDRPFSADRGSLFIGIGGKLTLYKETADTAMSVYASYISKNTNT